MALIAAACCRAAVGAETNVGAEVALPHPDDRGGTATATPTARWKGVDETVIEKTAIEAGHPPREPYINTDQGDLLLFLFLTAGAVGGFIAGYAFRALFPPKEKS